MQVRSRPQLETLLDRLVERELPSGRGIDAWRSLLMAHATLIRQMETDLERDANMALADFDVLAQLSIAGGSLRMTELAAKALISRSGMTRRVARLTQGGLVQRSSIEADGRGVMVELTDAGVARLREAAPIHLRGIAKLFIGKLNDEELAVLSSALDKVRVDCTFG
jgi:DNA-binding MarR family transcriptional regulator